MKIGKYQLANRLVLAPMAGVTDRPFRELCKQQGAGLAVSEMVTSDIRLWSSRKSSLRMDHRGETEPRIVQIAGADPDQMAAAAAGNVALGAQVIDINMGCPAKKVCNKAAGSALLQDEDLVKRILAAVVEAVDVPVTLKIRTGWDREHRNGPRIAVCAEQAGIAALAVHGRTRADAYGGEAEYQTIKTIVRSVNIPVIANGDITGPEMARHVLEETGAAGIMIGRAAQGRPWIFREIEHYLATGKFLPAPRLDEIETTLLGHLENLYSLYGDLAGVRVARKHIGWYCKADPRAEQHRRRMVKVETPREQLHLAQAMFADLMNLEELAA